MGFEIEVSGGYWFKLCGKNRAFLLDRLGPFFGIQSFLRFHEFSTKLCLMQPLRLTTRS